MIPLADPPAKQQAGILNFTERANLKGVDA